MSRVVIQNLVKRYGTALAVKEVSIDIAEGEFLTLLGSSGCGKTTTLRCVAGLEAPDGGEIYFDERPISKVPAYQRSCGMVFQNYALFPHMTLAENVAYGLTAQRYRGAGLLDRMQILARSTLASLTPAEVDQVREALDRVELGHVAERRPGQLSGGQQQRIALARALVTHPKVLLCDEPLGALDARLRVKMREEIRRIQKQAGITTLYVTHDQEEALAISDRIAVMNGGVIVQMGHPEDLYTRPQTRFIADFIGLENIFEAGRADAHRVQVDGLVLQVDGTVEWDKGHVAIRPDTIRLHPEGDQPNTFDGIVKLRMFMGGAFKYVIQVGSKDLIVHVPQHLRQADIDEAVRLAIPPAELRLLEN
ncbi:MAG TPA: ABC transporter ATP-binding protein [Candidatus Xenobia bacterium]|jgi:ABC-type Fe3+/spermidine/putrescine transport system ATPase subunit